LTINGNLTNNGTFTHNSGTVVVGLDNTTTTIGGSAVTTFHDFTSTALGKTIQFKAGQDIGFAGTLTITGTQAGGGYINLYSDTPGSQWLMLLSGTQAITFARVADAGCAPGTGNIFPHESVVNQGNNDVACWKFVGPGADSGATDGGPGGGAGSGGGGSGGGGGGGGGGGSSDLPETFTAGDGTALETHNSSWTLLNGNFAINTNAVHSNTAASDTMAQWNGTTFSNDQFAEMTIVAVATGGYIGVAVRTQDGVPSGYGVYCNSDDIKLIEWNAGTPTTHHTGSACAGNDLIRLEIVGTTLTLKRNGATLTTVIDATYSSGKPGLVGNANLTTIRADSWTAGSISGGGGGGGSP
jgi:hypothetical protein